MVEGKALVGGKWVEGRETFSVFNPFNREVVGKVPDLSLTQVEEALVLSRKGASLMESLPAHRRADILLKASSLLSERREHFAQTIMLESGKAIKYARGETDRATQTFRFAAEEAKNLPGDLIPMSAVPGSEKRTAFYQHFPLGVIGAITPFNFPLNLVAHKVAPALAAGNAVVLKPSDMTPLTSLLLGELLLEAGLPPEALSILTSPSPKIGEAIVRSPEVSMVSFTGSATVGEIILKNAGIKRVALELGANSAAIVEPESPIEEVATKCVTGAFAYGGQVCISLQRIFVHEKIYEDFVDQLVAHAKKISLGDPSLDTTEYGPLITAQAHERCLAWIAEARQGGSTILCGGELRENCLLPTIIADAHRKLKVCCEEVFGPIVTVTPYGNFGEALDAVNDSDFGLQAGVFTTDVKKSFEAFHRLKVGGVIINDIPTYRADNMPYGGIKRSGLGREGVKFAMAEMGEMKALVFNL